MKYIKRKTLFFGLVFSIYPLYAIADSTNYSTSNNSFKDCSQCPTMMIIPSGEFSMGTKPGGYEKVEKTGEMPAVNIHVPEDFAISETEITVAEFAYFIASTDYKSGKGCRIWINGRWTRSKETNWQNSMQSESPKKSHPVNCVSQKDAQAYTVWLSEATGENYRLPSEAEWEYSARGNVKAPRWWGWNSFEGVSISTACENANVYDVSAAAKYAFPWPHARCTDKFKNLAPVKSFNPNPYGLYDMIGNVWEWTQDCYTGSYINRPADSRAWEWQGGCETRVIRGGSWSTRPLQSRVTNRQSQKTDFQSSDLGFRVVRNVKNDSEKSNTPE